MRKERGWNDTNEENQFIQNLNMRGVFRVSNWGSHVSWEGRMSCCYLHFGLHYICNL